MCESDKGRQGGVLVEDSKQRVISRYSGYCSDKEGNSGQSERAEANRGTTGRSAVAVILAQRRVVGGAAGVAGAGRLGCRGRVIRVRAKQALRVTLQKLSVNTSSTPQRKE